MTGLSKKFTTIVNEAENYRNLKESVKMLKIQRSHIERNKLIEDGQRMEIDKIIKQNRRLIIT